MSDASGVGPRIRMVMELTGWSARRLSTTAGLSHSSVTWILNHPDENHGSDTLKKIARAGGVSESWLINGVGSPDDRPAPSAATPAESRVEAAQEERPAPTTLTDALDDAFDRRGRRHSLEDSNAVRAALGETFRFESGVDPVGAARTWLDAARNLRERGATVTPGALIQELTFGRDARARQVGAERDAAADAEGDAAADALGLARRAAPGAPPSDRPVAGTEGMPSEGPADVGSTGTRKPFVPVRDAEGGILGVESSARKTKPVANTKR